MSYYSQPDPGIMILNEYENLEEEKIETIVTKFGAPEQNEQTCGRCGTPKTIVWKAENLVSQNYSGWEGQTTWLLGAGGAEKQAPYWCRTCALIAITPEPRRFPWVVKMNDKAYLSSPSEIAKILLENKLSINFSICVPVSKRKNLVDSAKWGMISTDGGTLPWSQIEHNVGTKYNYYRKMGFSHKELSLPVPTTQALSKISPEYWEKIMKDWESFEPWRKTPYWQMFSTFLASAG